MDTELSNNMALASKAFGDMVLLPLYLVTMTMCFKTTFSSINVEVLCSDFISAACLCDARVTNVRKFKNCIIFKISEGMSNISAKVFTNGTLHFTGVKAFVDAVNVARRIISVLELVGDAPDITIKSQDVQMLNVCFKFRHQFHMNRAFSAIQEKIAGETMVFYDKQKHAAIKIKAAVKRPSILMFKTGSVIICGCKSAADVLETAQMFNNLLQASDVKNYII
jgi:TATA-box binding protein (TBP) (component of TFIID and TFIIIB)